MYIASSNGIQQYIYSILKLHSRSRILMFELYISIYLHRSSDVKFYIATFQQKKHES